MLKRRSKLGRESKFHCLARLWMKKPLLLSMVFKVIQLPLTTVAAFAQIHLPLLQLAAFVLVHLSLLWLAAFGYSNCRCLKAYFSQ